MITPELIKYIQTEFAKGRKREEIQIELVKDGGWSEVDLNEAFNKVKEPLLGSLVVKTEGKPKAFWHNFIFIVVGLLCIISWYFYSLPKVNFWNSSVNKVEESSMRFLSSTGSGLKDSYISYWNFLANIFKKNPIDDVAISPSNTLVKNTNTVKDCGIGTTPDLKNPLTYKNNGVLNCLGNSALRCEEAKAVLSDALFPTIFQITKNKNTCNFKLSYAGDSTLVDATGKKLAGQYISCPISIVKAIDETKSVPSFNTPSLNDPSKYASQIYFYGTLGLFVENNVNKSKIQGLGCSGEYISSVIASYNKTQ